MRLIIGGLLITFQLFMIAYARFSPTRYFCWAPHDQQSVFDVSVTISQKPLTNKQIDERYRLRTWRYWENGTFNWVHLESRSIENIKSIIRQYETTYGKNDRASVVLNYRINGGQEETWRWQPQ